MAKKDFTLTQSTLRLLYFQYKEYLIPLCIILFSLFLTVFFIIPQFQEYITMQRQAAETKGRIVALKKNIQTLSDLDTTTLSADYQTVSRVLPSEKDFIGVLSAISKASANAGVSVGDFSFSVGNLATPSAQLGNRPSFAITLTISGSYNNTKQFLSELSNASPVAEVTSFSISGNSATIGVSFYYTALPQTIQVQYDLPPPLLTTVDKNLINRFRSWQENIPSLSASFVSF